MDDRRQRIGPAQWAFFAVGLVLVLGALVVGLRPVRLQYERAWIVDMQRVWSQPPQVRSPGRLVVDCGSAWHRDDAVVVKDEVDGSMKYVCGLATNDARGLSLLALFLGAVLVVAPVTFLRRTPTAAVNDLSVGTYGDDPVEEPPRTDEPTRPGEPTHPGETDSLVRPPLVRQANQFIVSLSLWFLLGAAVLFLIRLNWGVRTYYAGTLPPQGAAKLAMSAALVLAFVALCLLVRGWCLHRWPRFGRAARHLLALGAVTVAVSSAAVATAYIFETVDHANCYASCDR